MSADDMLKYHSLFKFGQRRWVSKLLHGYPGRCYVDMHSYDVGQLKCKKITDVGEVRGVGDAEHRVARGGIHAVELLCS